MGKISFTWKNAQPDKNCRRVLLTNTLNASTFMWDFQHIRKISYMGQQMKKGISTHCSYSQRDEEGEKEFEASLVDDGNQNHAQQGEQADDSDGDDAADPGCRETVALVHGHGHAKQTGE